MIDEEKQNVSSENTEEKTEETVQNQQGQNPGSQGNGQGHGREKKLKAEVKKLSRELGETKAKYEEVNDKYLRMAAEYDNYRKRTQKELEDRYTDAYADALAEFLPMADNLERAMTYKDSDKFAEGIKIIVNQFNQTLEKLSIVPFGEVGETFDPNIHNAIAKVEDESLGENVIAEVYLKGYKRGDKIIRCAMVKVAN